MSAHPLDAALNQVNQRLRAARLGVVLERRGEMLGLRGTLPPKPGSDRQRPYQQRLSLGLPATKMGLKQAEQEAKVVAARLIERSFSWRPYLSAGAKALASGELKSQITAFEHHYRETGLAHPDRNAAAIASTWAKAYAPYLRKLQAIAAQRPALSLPELLLATVQSFPPHARSRQVCCTALIALGEFLSLDPLPDLRPLAGSYGPHRTQRRQLPTDEMILAGFDRIPNPQWQFVYGIMATYGLRNHEVFFCDYQALWGGDPEAAIEVLETTKTGAHDVWPFPPAWIDRFHLRQGRPPALETDLSRTTLQRIGQQVTQQFRRYGVPFSPYDLRHAWAVRTILLGLPDTVAARMMGHSVAIHNRTYHRWISRRDQQAAVRTALSSN